MSENTKHSLMMFAVIFIICCAGTIVGCVYNVSPEVIELAQSMCESNEGLENIRQDGFRGFVYCVNGAKFDYK